jgi:predicted nucleotidyltransferase
MELKSNHKHLDIHDLYRGNLSWLKQNVILYAIAGSRAYGIHTEDSDTDVKGVCVAPKEYYLGFKQFEQAEFKRENESDPSLSVEGVIYDIRKFVSLAKECNPNIIELLYTDDEDFIFLSEIGEMLVSNRDLFLSKKAKAKFSGYAFGQLTRIKGHRSWLLNPPKKVPERKDFGLSEVSKLSQSKVGAMEHMIAKTNSEFGEDVMALYHKEQAYLAAKRHWEQYQNWQRNRNPKRAALEAKFGYDLKHASHLYRLMKMCEEILSEGKVVVKRPDRKDILAIRNGAWSYDQLIEWADTQDKRMDELLEASTLPSEPGQDKIEGILVAAVEKALYGL